MKRENKWIEAEETERRKKAWKHEEKEGNSEDGDDDGDERKRG